MEPTTRWNTPRLAAVALLVNVLAIGLPWLPYYFSEVVLRGPAAVGEWLQFLSLPIFSVSILVSPGDVGCPGNPDYAAGLRWFIPYFVPLVLLNIAFIRRELAWFLVVLVHLSVSAFAALMLGIQAIAVATL